ncbi:MAG: helix-turn-helix domain-containing protein [Oscillospiraceae bacterium]
MAYKKSSEEIKWLKWKAAEEEKLRALGAEEAVISRLRVADWEDFKAERNYQLRQTVAQEYTEQQGAIDDEPPILTVQNLLDSIENEKLLNVLMKTDKVTLQILLLKSIGLSSKEIARKLEISEKAVYRRIDRFREKQKNIF